MPKKCRCLVIVQNGVASVYCDDSVEIEVLDLDDTEESDDIEELISEEFRDLLSK